MRGRGKKRGVFDNVELLGAGRWGKVNGRNWREGYAFGEESSKGKIIFSKGKKGISGPHTRREGETLKLMEGGGTVFVAGKEAQGQ